MAVDALGGLDILVNNAGGGWFESFADTSDDHIEQSINLNIRGTVYATHEAIKHLPDGGRVITIGSVNAESIPFPGGVIYGMTKGASVSFTKGLARDLGPRGNHRQRRPTWPDRYGVEPGGRRGRRSPSRIDGAESLRDSG